MSMTDQTPRAGDNTNTVDYAAEETRRLEIDYAPLAANVEELLAEAAAIELPIQDDAHKGTVASTIKKLRDTATRIEGLREIEKLPHLRRGNAVDQWFGRLRIALRKDNKRDRNAVGDDLQDALTAYDARKLAEEQARRRAEAERLAREAAKKAAEEAAAKAAAEEARLAAERARKRETQEAKGAVAEQAEQAASTAGVETNLVAAQAEQAYVDTLARPSDIMRRRGADGVLTTMGTEKFAEITDLDALDIVALRPFIKVEALEQALRGLAASRGYSNDERMQIKGAVFGTRAKSVVR